MLSGLIVLCVVAGLAASFDIKAARPKNLSVDEGGSIELFCAVDGYYEWCTFKRQDGKICDFEWKRDLWDVDVLQCSDFAGRMTRIGEFSSIFDSKVFLRRILAKVLLKTREGKKNLHCSFLSALNAETVLEKIS